MDELLNKFKFLVFLNIKKTLGECTNNNFSKIYSNGFV